MAKKGRKARLAPKEMPHKSGSEITRSNTCPTSEIAKFQAVLGSSNNKRDSKLKHKAQRQITKVGPRSRTNSNKLNIKDDANSLKGRLVSHLQSANFRILNELLHSNKSCDGCKIFYEDPMAFQIYHEGYNSQISQWPFNPLDLIIQWLRKKPRSWLVADFGCGEATLEKSIPQKVFSLDLVACKPSIIKCDMAHTPLESNSVNVVVCCLSLMGTNISDFILETNRVLVHRGVLKIAEVESRFGNINLFLKQMLKLGFKCIKKNQEQYFWLFDFLKVKPVNIHSIPIITLKPCIYKKQHKKNK